MDDFFSKEITPFAKIVISEEKREQILINTPELVASEKFKLEWLERWKFIDTGTFKNVVYKNLSNYDTYLR